MSQDKPGIGGPLGERDFMKYVSSEDPRRVKFLLEQAPRLADLGVVPMWELKGDDLSGGWVRRAYELIEPFGGKFTWHPSQKLTRAFTDPEASKEITRRIAEQVEQLRKWGIVLVAVTIHLSPLVTEDPPEDAGDERYYSKFSSIQMMQHLEQQTEVVKELNKRVGGILHVENVDSNQFRDGGCRLPTYLALQSCSWNDLWWMKDRTDCQVTFDVEHGLGAKRFLCREGVFADLPVGVLGPSTSEERWMISNAGYVVRKGEVPVASETVWMLRSALYEPTLSKTDISDYEYLKSVLAQAPSLIHLGGGDQPFEYNVRGEIVIGTHKPNRLDNLSQVIRLEMLVRYGLNRPGFVGWIDEVTGQLDPDKYSPWSSDRPADDDEAKMLSLTSAIEMIKVVKKGG